MTMEQHVRFLFTPLPHQYYTLTQSFLTEKQFILDFIFQNDDNAFKLNNGAARWGLQGVAARVSGAGAAEEHGNRATGSGAGGLCGAAHEWWGPGEGAAMH